MQTLFGIEMTDEEFGYLFEQQSQGKELKVIDGNVVAVDHEVTQEELDEREIYELEVRLNQLTQDFIQIQCGAVFEDADERIAEFQEKHNRLRYLKGKEPRVYK